MPTVFNSEEERLAYLISLNSTDAMRQLKEFVASSNSSVEALERLTKVTMEYAKIAKISFNSAKMSMVELNAAYRQAVASGNALAGGAGGAGGLGGGTPPLDPNVFRQGASFGGAGGIGGINSTLKEIPSNSNKAKSALSSLATTFKHVIVGMLAFRVIQFFMDMVTGINAATEAAKDFYKSLVNIQIGVRAMNVAGLEGSLSDVTKEIQRLKSQFPVFSEADLAAGFSNSIIKASQMGMTIEELSKVMEIAAGQQILTGKSMETATDAILNAMMSSSGRMTVTIAEATGIQINQIDVLKRAQELGFLTAQQKLTDMTKEERKVVLLSLLWEQYLVKQEDIQSAMGAAPAQLDAVTASWEDLTRQVGNYYLQLKVLFAPFLFGFVKNLSFVLTGVLALFVRTLALAAALSDWNYKEGGLPTIGKLEETDVYKRAAFSLRKFLPDMDSQSKEVEKLFGDLGGGAGDAFAEGLTEEQQTSLDEFAQNIEQMALDIQRQLEQDTIDSNRKLAELNAEYERDVLSMYEDYNRDVADANESAIQSVADANAEYRDSELKEERDYQNKLQRLKDEFLFDMEDALRERDARQILRLMRRYQLDKKNIVRDGDDQREERRRNLAEELADIEKQRLRKLEDLAQELVYKKQKLYDDWQQNRTDTQLRFDQDQEDEKTRNTDKLQDLVDALAEQGLATQAGAEAIRKILMTYFGPGGYTEAIYKYLIAQIMAAAKAMLMLNSIAGAMGGGSGGGTKPGTAGGNQPRQFASGGAMIASRPTTAVFGEGGEPELAVFLPLSKIRNPTARTSPNVGGAGGGRIKLDVTLSPDLEARIIQQASDNVATTITRIQREK
jgi:hypothetical protein